MRRPALPAPQDDRFITRTAGLSPPFLWPKQVQYSLLDRRPENGMADYCALHDIQLLPYGTVAGGFLSDRYLGVPASKCVRP